MSWPGMAVWDLLRAQLHLGKQSWMQEQPGYKSGASYMSYSYSFCKLKQPGYILVVVKIYIPNSFDY